ncbi:MAG: hypothetical protein OEY01_02175 [Desulfobulbaceae bacterium]|nr:hypothetical protein [Desulfobulbaceae bacterium]HIJ78100.1 hypothetical protein [Deltaproteobacteria bacterium]
MILDPTATGAQNNIRTDRPEPYSGSEQANRTRTRRQESNQTSEVSPDVVNEISAAALEASRALSQASQTADQNPPEDMVRASERREEPPPAPREQPPPAQEQRRSIDLVA